MKVINISISSSFEDIELEYGDDDKFVVKKWDRENEGGGGEMSIMYGKIFEKVGINISTVYGEFSEEFAKENNFYWFYTLEGRHGDDNAGLDNPSYFTFKQI